jgi:phage terminase large subunit GpA-like protein
MSEDSHHYQTGFIAGLTPDPDLTVSEWADEYRYLSQKASAEPGRWRTDRTPYLREIMDSLSPSSPIQRVVFQAGAQVGKTETGNNWLGFVIHMAPGPIMLVQPTVDTAKRLSKQRIAPMIDESPVLRERIADSRARDSSNTMMVKEFAGGVMILTGANSAVGLRSMPVRYLFLDEIDGYPSDIEGEGDPVNLAERRTTTFARRKVFMCSTPTVKETSRIEREYLSSDQRRFFVQCPQCSEFQWLKWGGPKVSHGIKWDNDDPTTAHYVCEHNGCVIEEFDKTEMMAAGEWRPTADGDGRTAGFHLSSLYSPLGWKSWAEIVAEFLKAKGDPPLLKTWVNTILGETWEDEIAAKVGAGDLLDRVEFYEANTAPAGVLAVTIGIDMQDNRAALTKIGWGEGEESWVLDHQEIYGDPARPELWAALKAYITEPIKHELYEDILPLAICIDSGGHHTHEVYAWAREHRDKHVMAIKGQSQKDKPIIGRPSKQDLNMRGQVIKNGAELWPVGTDTAKSTIYSRLKIPADEPGPGYIHFHANMLEGYFEQLTAEKLVTKYVKGFPVRTWTKKSGARNEALDTFVYAIAALQAVYFRFNRRTIWEQLRGRMTVKVQKTVERDERPLQVNRPRRKVRQNSSFVQNW